MRRGTLLTGGLVALAAAGVLAFANADGEPGQGTGLVAARETPGAPAVPVPAQPAAAIAADPSAAGRPAAGEMTLAAPEVVQPGDAARFEAVWRTADGVAVDGELSLQTIEGNAWTTVSAVRTRDGSGQAELPVAASGVYRIAYGGNAEYPADASAEVVVLAAEPLGSRLTVTAAPAEDGTVTVSGAWTTVGGVPIIGDLEVQLRQGGQWVTMATVTTGPDGTAVADVGEATGSYRIAYPGGARFAPAASDETLVLSDDVRTIPVSTCSTDHEIDVLSRGEGCHFTPVEVATFVVGHDYLGNAWWNAMPIGSVVELTGHQSGVFEVVDRVIAPGRGSALGSASNWTCDDRCDVILQTCQGKNTGFTWLRRVGESAPAA
jgi:hypothetical protein